MLLNTYEKTGFAFEVLSKPPTNEINLVLNPCNCLGLWHTQFQKDLSKYNPLPQERYREWSLKQEKWAVGNAQLVKLPDNVWVLNFLVNTQSESKELIQVLYPKIIKLMQDNPTLYISYLYTAVNELILSKIDFEKDLNTHIRQSFPFDSKKVFIYYEPF